MIGLPACPCPALHCIAWPSICIQDIYYRRGDRSDGQTKGAMHPAARDMSPEGGGADGAAPCDASHPIPCVAGRPDPDPARRRRQSYYCSRQSTVASPVAQSRGGVAPLNLNHGQSRAGIVRNRRVRTVHALDWIVEAMNGDFAFSFPIGSHDQE
jgi:hypothetical protein